MLKTLIQLGAVALVSALNTTTSYSSYCTTISEGELCYAINVPSEADSSNLYISMTGPSTVGYSGLGFGSGMRNALYFIALPTSNNVTMSIRTASGNVMPVVYSNSTMPVTLSVLPGTMNNGSTWVANFECTNCRTWDTGSLDIASTSASFIWAAGSLSTGALSSSSDANIKYHGNQNGVFQMNLVTATGNSNAANITQFPESTIGASAAKASSSSGMSYQRRLWYVHAVFMTVGWILVIGLGAILIRFFPSYFGSAVRAHYIFQVVGVCFIIIGTVLGIVGSGHHFKYAHQTLGIITFALVFFQAAFGTIHHVIYLKGVRGRVLWLGKIHRWFGRALIVTAMVTAGLALRLPQIARSKGAQIAWYVVMGCLVLVYTVANFVFPSKERGLGDDKISAIEKERSPSDQIQTTE